MDRKTVFNIGFVTVAAAVGLALSFKPWQVARQEQKKADAAKARSVKAERETAEKLREKAQFGKPMDMERRAREDGNVAPDEVPIK